MLMGFDLRVLRFINVKLVMSRADIFIKWLCNHEALTKLCFDYKNSFDCQVVDADVVRRMFLSFPQLNHLQRLELIIGGTNFPMDVLLSLTHLLDLTINLDLNPSRFLFTDLLDVSANG